MASLRCYETQVEVVRPGVARSDPRPRRVSRLSDRPPLRRGFPGGQGRGGDSGRAAAMTALSSLSAAETRRALYLLTLIRAFEERVLTLVSDGSIRGTTHPYVGQEAVAVGACLGLRPDDWVVSTHRGHGHLLAKGGDPERPHGRAVRQGQRLRRRQGRHAAHGRFLRRLSRVQRHHRRRDSHRHRRGTRRRRCAPAGRWSSCSSATARPTRGPSTSRSTWRRSGACRWCTCARTTSTRCRRRCARPAPSSTSPSARRRTPCPASRPTAWTSLRSTPPCGPALERARAGRGPTLIECKTYRFLGHSKSDQRVYRSRDEEAAWRARDPIARLRSAAHEHGVLSAAELDAITREAVASVDAAVAFARQSPFPTAGALTEGVFTDAERGTREPAMRELTYWQALQAALCEAMRRDPRVFLMGEDIGAYGGAFGVTRGMLDEFGPERVRCTPISEATIVGAATGAALTGMRPVVEIMFMDFLTLAMDQLANHAAKFRYMYGPQARVPLVRAHPGRRRPLLRRDALAEPRGVAAARARPEGHCPGDAGGCRRGCWRRRSTTTTRWCASSTSCSTPRADRCRTTRAAVPDRPCLRAPRRRRCHARGLFVLRRRRRCRRRRCWPPTASTPR